MAWIENWVGLWIDDNDNYAQVVSQGRYLAAVVLFSEQFRVSHVLFGKSWFVSLLGENNEKRPEIIRRYLAAFLTNSAL